MQNKQHPSIRQRLAAGILGIKTKDFIQALSPLDGWSLNATGRLKEYQDKPAQLSANTGWCFTANTAIVDPCSAVKLQLFKTTKGKREEITEHEILQLIKAPNLAFTGKQLRQLHFTYMNFTGESYIYMMEGKSANPFIPRKGRLPDALNIFPSHRVQMILGKTYTTSIVKMGEDEYPLMAFIRDLNPDPANPYYGRSVIAAAAQAIDTEYQMKAWNERFFANNARTSLVFNTNEEMSNESYERWKQQFADEHTGTENAYKPLLVEGGSVTSLVNQTDLDFINSRKFSRDEILAMWRVSPGMIGSVENVNRSNLEAGFYIHAVVNTVPRISQFVEQMNATLVTPYDPSYELDFVNPVPEDVEAKLQQIQAGNGAWLTIDEARAAYGMEPLPLGLGNHVVIVAGKQPATLDAIVAGEKAEADKPQDPEDPGNDNGDKPNDEDPGDDDPEDDNDKGEKRFKEILINCDCCGGTGKHKGKECVRCDGDGDLFISLNNRPIPCANRIENLDSTPGKSLAAPKTKDLTAQQLEEAKKRRQERGDAKIQLYNGQADLYVQQMLTALRQLFTQQQAEILQNAALAALPASQGGKVPQKDKLAFLAALLSWTAATDAMRRVLQPILYALIVDTAKGATAEINLDPSTFNPTTLPVLNYASDRAQKAAQQATTETQKQLKASLGQGIDAGESPDQLAARISLVMGAALTKRANNIAQYEVTRAQGFADIEAWKQSGIVSGKMWIVQSGNPCSFCLSLDGVIVSLDSDFYSLGDVITADGKSMAVNYENIPSQPCHNHCECGLEAVMVTA